MAKFKAGIAFAQIKGSIGGTTFSQNANGVYIRNRSKPSNPRSVKQQAQRQLTGSIAGNWKAADQLSFASQTAYYPYIDSIGETKTYTAYQLYLKANQNALACGGSPILRMGTFRSLPFIDSLSVAILQASGGSILLSGLIDGDNQVPAGFALQVFASYPQTQGQTSNNIQYKKIAVIGAGSSGLNAVSIESEYENTFGAGWREAEANGLVVVFKFYLVDLSTGMYNSAGYITRSEIS